MARFPDGYILVTKLTETKLKSGNVVINMNVEEKELVMCKHCKHRRDQIGCPLHSEGVFTPDDWYCADGEKEEEYGG